MPDNTVTARLIIDVRGGEATRELNRTERSSQRFSASTRIARRQLGLLNRIFQRSLHAISPFRIATSLARRALSLFNRVLRGTLRALNPFRIAIGLARRILRVFGRTIATIRKALLSMIAVLIVFNIFITLPQAAFQALITIIRATISTISEFEQRILGLQAILSSTVTILQDPIENFRNAGLVAAGVIEQLALRANEMVTSLTEASIVFQTLLATGAQQVVRDVDKLVDLTILLSNSIAGITTGQSRQRQLAEETRSLFTQQLRANSLLTRILFNNRREMREFFQEAERADKVVERLSDRLRGFALAARDLGSTIEGLRTTFITLLQVVAFRAFSGLVNEAEQVITRVFERIQQDIAGLNTLAASLAASVEIILRTIGRILRDTFGLVVKETDDFLSLIIRAMPRVTFEFLRLIFLIKDVIKFFSILGNVASIIVIIVQIIGTILTDVGTRFNSIISFIGSQLPTAIASLLKFITGPLVSTNAIDALGIELSKIGEIITGLFTGPSVGDRAREALADFPEALARHRDIIVRTQTEREAALKRITALRRLDLSTNIAITDELLKQSRSLRSQVTNILQVIRLSRTGAGRGFENLLGGSLEELEGQLRERIGTLRDQLLINEFALNRARNLDTLVNSKEVQDLTLRTANLRGEIAALVADLIALSNAFAQVGRTTFEDLSKTLSNLAFGRVFRSIFNAIKSEGSALRSLFKGITSDIIAFIKSAEGQVAIMAAIGNALATAITSALKGAESFGQALKNVLANLLIAIGQALIVAGSASVLFGLLTFNAALIGEGVLAIAVGTAAIAAGIALGGGGQRTGAGGGGTSAESTSEFSFRQQEIATQQRLAQVTEGLRVSTENINSATENIRGVKPGEVFTKGSEQAGGITRVLANDVRRGDRFASTRDAALAFQGS